MRWRCLTVPVGRDGYRALRRFARYWAHLRFAIEGQPGWVRHLTTRRRADRSNAGVLGQNPGAWPMGISVRKVGDELNFFKLGSCHDHAPTHRPMATLHKHQSVARVLSFGVDLIRNANPSGRVCVGFSLILALCAVMARPTATPLRSDAADVVLLGGVGVDGVEF
jgi:hypothetical protein